MDTFVAIDFETADHGRDSACAVGLVRVEGAAVVRRAAALIRPPRPAMLFEHVHGLSYDMVKDAPPFAEVWAEVSPVLDGAARLVAHNAAFDRSVLAACCHAAGIPAPAVPWTCTHDLARRRWPKPASNALPAVCERLGVELAKHHDAGADAEACARVLIALEGRVAVDAQAAAEPRAAVGDAMLAELARLLAACPDMADLALDLQSLAGRGESAVAAARAAADAAEAHAARRRANCNGFEMPHASVPGEVRGEGRPGPGSRRVVWLGGGHEAAGRGGESRKHLSRVEMGLLKPGAPLPPEADYWTCDGSDFWVKVPGK